MAVQENMLEKNAILIVFPIIPHTKINIYFRSYPYVGDKCVSKKSSFREIAHSKRLVYNDVLLKQSSNATLSEFRTLLAPKTNQLWKSLLEKKLVNRPKRE